MVTVVNSVFKRRLRILTNKYHYSLEITFNWNNVMSCTLHGSKADIVHLMNMSQHKRFAFVNWTMWRNDYIIAMGQTADHTNARFKVVCCGTQNHVITPSAILFHVYQVFSPCLMSMYKVKQICSIRLQEELVKEGNLKELLIET